MPVDAIVTYSSSFRLELLLFPPPITPLVADEQDANLALAELKSPKSVPLPVEAIVMYSISLKYPESLLPPENTPLPDEEAIPPN